MINSSIEEGHEAKSLFGANKKLLFALLCLCTIAILYVKIILIENETAAFEFLQDRPEGFVLKTLNALKFLSVPFVYLWKFTVIAFVIWVGCFMFGYRVTYSQCWGVVIASEFIFLVPELIKVIWFLFVVADPDYEQIRAFYPFSMIQLVDYSALDKRYAYPLKALNIFEIGYWLLLVNGIHFYARKEKRYVWIIVSCSYILLFFLWLVFYMIVYK